ncbi:DUF4097 family beta strand repeat-containing protein [Haliangium ochraceum]|uniref:DUF4097 domain-containing protein n=1 Tax=Haliangium ochraceum (strain DSM 14365 / JCM 11303 / SMP-2) TaxID=502025 RepID=D0LKU3_HALO1|nr:DUF4097 family beta strand repeat-containing protein [Haliangium ochraceum]ACY16663.1 hypothetical protein Hoch_4165 [Haliangium ochraceum DSM 14365]
MSPVRALDRPRTHRLVLCAGVLAALASAVPAPLIAAPPAADESPRPSAEAAGAEAADAEAGAVPESETAPSVVRSTAMYERDVLQVDAMPGATFSALLVDNRLGSVRIEGHDLPSILISATKRAPDARTLERLKVSLIPDANGPLRIQTAIAPGDARPLPGGAVRIDLLIRAPRSASLRAQVWNGRLVVIGMENGADLSANDGDIEVQNASGRIATYSAGGRQELVEVVGKVDAQLLRGDVDLVEIRGERLDASVHDGRIDTRAVRVRQAWVRTTLGDISFEGYALAGGEYRFASVRGNVEVALVALAPIAVQAEAGAGSVALPAGMVPQRRNGAPEGALVALWPMGRGQPASLELRSRLGNIRFSLVH